MLNFVVFFAVPGGAVYRATKAFVINFTEALWYEYKDLGCYVMALLPGVTDTNFHHVAMGQRGYKAHSGPSYPPEVMVKEALVALQKRKSFRPELNPVQSGSVVSARR